MKKFFKAFVSIFLITLTALIFPACSSCSSPDLYSRISELRKDLFSGKSDNFSVIVYAGTKEDPAVFDGEVNPATLLLTFKVTAKEEIGNQVTIKFKIGDKTYEKALNFSPVASALSGHIAVDTLPEKTLDVEIKWDENSEVVCTNSLLKKSTITYIQALEKASEKASDFIKNNSKKGQFKGEIVVRLLCENDKNYFYIGFVDKSGLKEAYLIDGISGEVLAEKKN